MALDDLGESVKEDLDEEQTEEMMDQLGVEDKEELERLDERIITLSSVIVTHDARIEALEDEIEQLKKINRGLMRLLQEDTNEEDNPWEPTQ